MVFFFAFVVCFSNPVLPYSLSITLAARLQAQEGMKNTCKQLFSVRKGECIMGSGWQSNHTRRARGCSHQVHVHFSRMEHQ